MSASLPNKYAVAQGVFHRGFAEWCYPGNAINRTKTGLAFALLTCIWKVCWDLEPRDQRNVQHVIHVHSHFELEASFFCTQLVATYSQRPFKKEKKGIAKEQL